MARKGAALTRVVTVGEMHGRRYRNKYVLDGRLVSDSFETEAEARQAAARFRRDHEDESGLTVSALIEKWMAWRQAEGLTEQPPIRNSLATMLAARLDEQASAITSAQMERAYELARGRVARNKGRMVAVPTHHNTLRWTTLFCKWSVETKYVRKNPCAEIKAVGRAAY